MNQRYRIFQLIKGRPCLVALPDHRNAYTTQQEAEEALFTELHDPASCLYKSNEYFVIQATYYYEPPLTDHEVRKAQALRPD